MRHDGVSGWYARLDRCVEDRLEQMDTWLTAWEASLGAQMPLPAMLPDTWPTLPAALLTEPGAVLDHLLARHDAESDGRSPRGAHPTPPRLADAMISAELIRRPRDAPKDDRTVKDIAADALPPGFRAHLAQLKEAAADEPEAEEPTDERLEAAIERGERTRSGIALPFADPAVGGGLFPDRLLKRHAEVTEGWEPERREADSRRLIEGLQLMDISEPAVEATRRRLHLAMVRYDLAALDDEPAPGLLARSEVEAILTASVRTGDTLRGDWPWDEQPRLLLGNPPWLRIKDRFRGHPDGSQLRKELGDELRRLVHPDGSPRYATLRGNVNLYRLFLERSLQIAADGGRIRLVVPDSLLREQSSAPLRDLLVESHEWSEIWTFPESARLFPGVTQGVLVLGVGVGGETDLLQCQGPLDVQHLKPSGAGVVPDAPRLDLDRERWSRWSRGDWSVPRLPGERTARTHLLGVIDRLALLPRLGEQEHWLAGRERPARVRVGEVDQTAWSHHIKPWNGTTGTPFIRGIHFTSDEEGTVVLSHPAFEPTLTTRAAERQQARWTGDIAAPTTPRLACQAIVNAQQTRRLRWVVMPAGCVLGNSVNWLELPSEVIKRLGKEHGDLDRGLTWLCAQLNGSELDEWARAWAANNNVNNYELETLPLQLPAKQPLTAPLVQ